MVSFGRVAAILACVVICSFGLLYLAFLSYIGLMTVGFLTLNMTGFGHCHHDVSRNVCALVIAPLVGVVVLLSIVCSFAHVIFVSACISVYGKPCMHAVASCVWSKYASLRRFI